MKQPLSIRRSVAFMVEVGTAILQTIFGLGLIVAVTTFAFKGLFWLVALPGLQLTILPKFILWYVLGLCCAGYWPWKYRKGMEKGDWKSFLKGLPFVAITGPLAIVFGFPL